MGALKLMKGWKTCRSCPEAPAIANYTTGEVMGHSSDRLAASSVCLAIYLQCAHTNAAKAHAEGLYEDEIVPVDGSVENGIKGDSTIDKVG